MSTRCSATHSARPAPAAGRLGAEGACGEGGERVALARESPGLPPGPGTQIAVYVLAWLANLRGPVAAAEYASKLTQRELQAIGAWKNPKTGRRVPVSKSTLG